MRFQLAQAGFGPDLTAMKLAFVAIGFGGAGCICSVVAFVSMLSRKNPNHAVVLIAMLGLVLWQVVAFFWMLASPTVSFIIFLAVAVLGATPNIWTILRYKASLR